MISETELLNNNGAIVDYWFDRFFETKNRLYIDNLLNVIKDHTHLNVKIIASSDSVVYVRYVKKQLTLYLQSRYVMELLSFYMNIKNDETLKDIVSTNTILDNELTVYIVNKKYSNIKKDSAKLLKEFFAKNKQLNKSLRPHFLDKNGLKRWFSESVINKYEIERDEKERLEKYNKGISKNQVLEAIHSIHAHFYCSPGKMINKPSE
ncbi:hypothetical protein AGMMS50268_41400 [Spirochaetia bacterium]|nr:hypothetical protein AGMMS50268_41400 [Spirochaetia bacterium]